jgi:hypothetical protein
MYKYTLEKKSRKHICPNCGEKRFVKYIDSETGDYLSSQVGRCDREMKCGYHYPPKSYFDDQNKSYTPITNSKAALPRVEKEMSLHTVDDLNNTLKNYEENNFIQFLNKKFEASEVGKMLKDYKVGTATNWHNSTIFWQIDQNQNIRGGKIINYSISGKRTKYINWVHAIKLKKKEINDFKLNQCLFGLNLLNKNNKTIAIVESEKTACIMSLFFDKYLWLATGSLKGLTLEKLEVLKDRKIILYPDLGKECKTGSPFYQWQLKCNTFREMGFDIDLSDLLERKSTSLHREKGYDLADYFLEYENSKPRKIISQQQQKFIDLYLRNHNLKTLIDVFDLSDDNGNDINF